jgi:hypothetical protein
VRPFALKLIAGLTGLIVLAADGAVAQTCFTLQAELEHLQSSGGGGDRSRYDRAYREQARVLSRTESRARNAGCFGGGFFFRREPDRSCRALIPKLQDMQDNMARLDKMRRRGGSSNARRIRAIRGLMEDRQCGRPGAERARTPTRKARVFQDDQVAAGGTYRTLCVRTCDGYYFPISYSTTRQQFAEDAQTCSAMCPAADSKLFYHPNPGSGPEDMVAVTGEPYSTLPTAFQYRTTLNPSCTCRPAGEAPPSPPTPGGRPSLEPKVEASAPLPGRRARILARTLRRCPTDWATSFPGSDSRVPPRLRLLRREPLSG